MPRRRRDPPAASGKPPYAVPSVEEIRRVVRNGLRVASTFSGCGGSCLGFRMAGYEVVWASEFVQSARDSYRANFPETTIDGRDIRVVRGAELLKAAGLRAGQLDVLEGSPPCAAFSTAGKRDKAWGRVRSYSDVSQRTDDLFDHYARLVRETMPRAFVAENVSGMVKGRAVGLFQQVMEELRRPGYRVTARLLDAQWLGVPQQRQRVIIVGVRDDQGFDPPFPTPLPYRYSMRDALPDLLHVSNEDHGPNSWSNTKIDAAAPAPSVATGPSSGGYYRHSVVHDTRGKFASAGDFTDRPAPAITVGAKGANSRHYTVRRVVVDAPSSFNDGLSRDGDQPAPAVMADGMYGAARHQALLEVVPNDGPPLGPAIAREWDGLREGQQSDRYFNLVRPDPSGPSPTVTAAGGNRTAASVTHPSERRKFTIAELRRICGFPDDFALCGTYEQQWERLGRAVPPPMMRAVAAALAPPLLAARGRR